MEIRVLKYFLAVAREQNISAAAQSLFLSQPTLSRQLKELEDELGTQLFIRGNRKITLTEDGMILRSRAQQIIDLVEKTQSDLKYDDDKIAGEIYIGAGESRGLTSVLKVATKLQKQYPMIHYHFFSGDSLILIERLERGLIDFGLLYGNVDSSKYDYYELPFRDTWGVLMRKDSPLAQKEQITVSDLKGLPLIISQQPYSSSQIFPNSNVKIDEFNVVASYNLLYNASLMVEEGMGYAVTFDKIANTSQESPICFRPLYPPTESKMNIVWKKYQTMSKASAKFIQAIQDEVLNR